MIAVAERTISPEGLSRAQRNGDACAVCDKRWPRPSRRIGKFPNGRSAMACPECAPETGG